MFDWQGTGLAGSVGVDSDPADPFDNVVSLSYQSTSPAIEREAFPSLDLTREGTYSIRGYYFAPVPIPASMPLLATGLSLIWLLRRRKRFVSTG